MTWLSSLLDTYPHLQAILTVGGGMLACVGAIYIFVLRSHLATRTRELTKLSQTDPLTGLFNHHKMEAIVVSELRRFQRYQRPFSVILLNMDHFKKINETYGHSAGNEVLVHLTSLLTVNIRGTDSIGRWDGDEFLIVCPETTEQQASRVAENLRKAIASYDLSKDHQCTASFGVTQVMPGDNSNAIFSRVNNSLHQAKKQAVTGLLLTRTNSY